MTSHHSPCQAKQLAGHLVWHEVRFHGPDTRQACALAESQRGQVTHVFKNGSI